MHRFKLWAWDRETDGQTDGLLNAPYTYGRQLKKTCATLGIITLQGYYARTPAKLMLAKV